MTQMIKLSIKRKNKPTMIAWFENQDQVEIFHGWVKDLIKAVKNKMPKERKK